MRLRVLPDTFTVCKMDSFEKVDLARPFFFAACTDEEHSLVCPTAEAPMATIAREDGWRAFRIEGVLDFGLVGILAGIASLMAENGIAIFAVSTFNTDYVFLKEEHLQTALQILVKNGYNADVAMQGS